MIDKAPARDILIREPETDELRAFGGSRSDKFNGVLINALARRASDLQADVAEPSTLVAQMPIAAGTLVMMLASPLLQQPRPSHRAVTVRRMSYFPLSAAGRFVVGIAAGSELSFETGVPLLVTQVGAGVWRLLGRDP
jgi:hypothetical protein